MIFNFFKKVFLAIFATKLSAKLSTKANRNTSQMASVSNKIKVSAFEQVENALINADVEWEIVEKILSSISPSDSQYKTKIKQYLLNIVEGQAGNLSNYKPSSGPFVLLFFGVNGSGKTTTIGKLSWLLTQGGESVLLAGCDTFRTAATEQLQGWVDKISASNPLAKIKMDGMRKPAEDPAAVCYRAIKKGIDEGFDNIFIDTSGRLHTNQNLMEELAKITRVIKKLDPTLPHLSLIVIDGSNGTSAVRQVEDFSKFAHIDGIIATKLDSSSKAGAIFTIVKKYHKKIFFLGNGESLSGLTPFSPQSFVDNFFEG